MRQNYLVIRRDTQVLYRIGVSDLQNSVHWYQKFLGFTYVEDQVGQEWVEMTTLCVEDIDGQRVIPIVKRYSIFLEKLSPDINSGRVDGPARSYFLIEDREQFEDYHRVLKANGITVSPITDALGTFHFYDPDGNRLNIWHY
jgi:catechol 2,3-dioxygenase-like lactoylglutathione lyase family enzyme